MEKEFVKNVEMDLSNYKEILLGEAVGVVAQSMGRTELSLQARELSLVEFIEHGNYVNSKKAENDGEISFRRYKNYGYQRRRRCCK